MIEDYEDLIVDNAARLLHEEFRKFITTTKSKIATYTLASYNLVDKYTLEEDEDSITIKRISSSDEEDLDYLIEEVWHDYTKLTEYLFVIDEYDRDYDDLKSEDKLRYERTVRRIIFSSCNIMKDGGISSGRYCFE